MYARDCVLFVVLLHATVNMMPFLEQLPVQCAMRSESWQQFQCSKNQKDRVTRLMICVVQLEDISRPLIQSDLNYLSRGLAPARCLRHLKVAELDTNLP